MEKKQLDYRFNLTYRYIDNVLSINNTEFENYLGPDVSCWIWDQGYHRETTSDSYLDLILSIWRDG